MALSSPMRPPLGSLLAQVLTVTLAALISLVALIWIMLQTALPETLLDIGLQEAGPSVAALVKLIDDAPTETRTQALHTFASSFRRASIEPDFPLESTRDEKLARAFADAVPDLDSREVRFLTGMIWREKNDALRPGTAYTAFEIDVRLSDGAVLRSSFAPALFISGRLVPSAMLILVAVSLVGVAAALLLRRTLRPLADLEQAAAALGSRLEATPVEERGPPEVRSLARTLNTMQERIASLVQDRTRTYTALAHDLRTGLTRLRLRFETASPATIASADQDLEFMGRLVEDMLLYARSAHAGEQHELIDIVRLGNDWATARGIPIEAGASTESRWIVGDAMSIQRVLDNLADNAHRYACDASLDIRLDSRSLSVCVLDRGPGINPTDVERLFAPFERGETSRNRDTGGSGLGLGIARELMRAIGGEVQLAPRKGGGLEACLVVPKALLID